MRTINVTVCDQPSVQLSAGISVLEALRPCLEATALPTVMAAFVNNEVRALSYRLNINAAIQPVYITSEQGQRVYRRSLCYALAIAADRALPQERLLIGHSLGNAYYYSLDGTVATEEALDLLRQELVALIQEDLSIRRGVASYEDALQYFNDHKMQDAALLVERHNYSEVPVYRCGEFMDLSHGPLAPRTGLLSTWRIERYGDGFLLVFATKEDPYQVNPGSRSTTLFQIYTEYKQWGRVLGISSVGELNRLTERGTIRDVVRVAEALHDKRIANIADTISAAGDDEKVILIAGPSSSGKTTFTKKLAVQLQVVGYTPMVISLDDYFVPREQTPTDADGNYDFENIQAIDIKLLNDHLVQLFQGQEVELPSFNFKTGTREYRGKRIQIPPRGVLLMEGIHGLNERLTPRIPRSRKFTIYVSALTQLNLDDHNRISTTDNRLLRRMVRDHQFRGHSALDTLTMWPSVRRGENANIFPFQDSADAAFNTALDYELGVLRNHAEPLLRQVKPHHALYHEAVRLQTFLRNFTVIPEKLVPQESILREFIGDSGFHY
ncbi:MAG: nucleoside kinase [Alkalispirochaeta sp.]